MKNVVYKTDCMLKMKGYADNAFDLAIVDPNYGRKEHGGKDRSKFVLQKNGSLLHVESANHKKKDWDNEPAGAAYFNELFRISKHQIYLGLQLLLYKFWFRPYNLG